MKISRWSVLFFSLCFPGLLHAQLDKIVIAAGTPEDQALQAITQEQDPQKKVAMYEDYLQKFSANPAAVAYGNWQLLQLYESNGDMAQAAESGEKAVAAAPRNLDILVSIVNLTQRSKDRVKTVEYAARGGEIYNSLAKQSPPEGMSESDFASRVEADKNESLASYEFLEAAAYNAIAEENDPKVRMALIEKFTPAFPDSRFGEAISSYAMMSLSDLKDMGRLVAYGEKVLATNPNHLPTLLLLAGAYVDDPKPGGVAKAVTYAQAAIAAANPNDPGADNSRKLSAGVAESTLGYALMKQDKTTASITQLKNATALLKGLDDLQYSIAGYRLGYAYAKLNRTAEARAVLNDVAKISGPMQPSIQDLLKKVGPAKAAAR